MVRETDDEGAGRISTDRETIREWADEHQSVPITYGGESAEAGSEEYRIVRESDVDESHERVEWDDFFARADEGDHVVVYHGAEATDPFEVRRRDEVLAQSDLSEEELEGRLLEGETVTSEVRETTVVESVVVEEATVESELVDSEVVDQHVVDVELVDRECTGCEVIETGDREADPRDWFDEDRYVRSIGDAMVEPVAGGSAGVGGGPERTDTEPIGETTDTEPIGETTDTEPIGETADASSVPYSAELDVEEVWSVTRGFTERFTVESRVADTEVAETDTVEDRDIDVEGLHRSISQSDLLDVGLTSDEVLSECEIRTEFTEDDRIHTQFERERVVEDEVVDRKRLRADVTAVDVLDTETVSSRTVTEEITDDAAPASSEPSGDETIGAEPTGTAGRGADETAGRVTLTDDEVGKTVVDASNEEVGMVAGVEENGEVMLVDAHPGITDRIKAALDWGGTDEDHYPVTVDQIARVTDDRVELKGTEKLGEDDRMD